MNLSIVTEIFDPRLKLFALTSGLAVIGNVLADVFDMAGKAGTLQMQALLIVCILILGGVIVWQNKGRESINKERHEESQRTQKELLTKLSMQQASMDAERVARIGKLMEQQRDDIEAKKELAFIMRELATSSATNNRVIGELERVVHRLVDHLVKNGAN